MFWEILKASKGLPVDDPIAALWGKKIAGGWKVTEITGELPLIFLSDGSALVDYRIYGISAGAGVETETKIYGWHVDPTISDPAQAITYIGDAIGKTPAAMGSGTFSYGDWSDAFFMPKPCMVRSDGTVDYYLDPNDYTKKADGTTSDIADPSYDGNAMMEWPLIWWKYEAGETEGEGYFYAANRKPDDTYHCWCNYDADDNITEHFYTAIYNGTGTSKMRSISGVALTSANGNGGTTATQEITRAEANNTTDKTEWYIDVWSDCMLINGLLILMGKSLNSQAVFGRGLDTGGQSAKEAYVTGTLNDKGLFWGDTSNGNSGVKVFGMENYWGCVWHRTAGLIGLSNGNTAYKLTYGTVDGTTADGYNTNGNGYLVDTTARPEGGYFKTAKFGKFGYLPLTTGGSTTTYYSDYWYTNNSALTFALVGGGADAWMRDGCSYFILSFSPDIADWSISSSLSFKPLAKTTPDTSIIPHGYKLPLTVESGETENLYVVDETTRKDYISLGFFGAWRYSPSYAAATTIRLPCKSNTRYTISVDDISSITIWRVSLINTDNIPDENVTSIPVNSIITQLPQSGSKSFTTNSDSKYILFQLDKSLYDTKKIMLVEGSTAPDHYIPHRYTSDIPIYIGSTKLGEEEYVDFGEQKVYKRTENLWNPNTSFTEGKFVNPSGTLGTDPGWRASDYVDIDFNEQYTFSVNTTAAPTAHHAFYNSNKQFVSSIEAGTQTFITPNDAVYARFSYRKTTTEIMLVKGSTAPDHHIPYGVEPTDPPVPLPPIPTYKGENTLSSTETLGEVTVKGRIKPEQLYRQVEYLKSTGTQIVVTDIIGSSANRYELDLKFGLANADSKRGFFGTIETSSGSVVTRLNGNWGASNDRNLGAYFFESTNASMKDLGSSTYRTNRNTFVISSTSASYGAVSWTPPAMTLGQLSLPLALFGVVEGSSTSEFKPFAQSDMWLYGCVVKNANGDKMHDLRPVERKDGELGLLDTITNKFYANAGTGTFEKGDYI